MPQSDRSCLCGTRLARDNSGSACSPCQRARALWFSTGDQGPLATRLGRRLGEIYSGYCEAGSRQTYLAELTPLLDGLCELFGLSEPRFEGITKPMWIGQAIESSGRAL